MGQGAPGKQRSSKSNQQEQPKSTTPGMVRVGINGFGRIGRLTFRYAWEMEGIEIVAVNEIVGGAETAAYLVQFDSVHGTWSRKCESTSATAFTVDGKEVAFSEEKDFTKVDWKGMGVEIVVDCTGKFLSSEVLMPYINECGVKRVVVSAPVKEPSVLNVVVGVNDDKLNESHLICTAASCTTNCIAPVIKVIHEKLGIETGMITTVHNITGTQSLVDMPNSKKKDLRRSRSGMLNLAPTSTGSATAVAEVFPELKGKLNGHAIRVPMLNSSITDMVFNLARETTVAEVNGLLQDAAAEGALAATAEHGEILGFETRPLVSTDYVNDVRSTIVDASSTMVVGGKMLKVYAWYDNEAGYSMRTAELTRMVANKFVAGK
uniref:Glyceraldehyde-3-phosphate dehydrogenase n=1 Tax=Chrysotila carterae TaxID=13221 RepID=A0A6T0B0G3_CHRCT